MTKYQNIDYLITHFFQVGIPVFFSSFKTDRKCLIVHDVEVISKRIFFPKRKQHTSEKP